jgi:hypothetical protein
VKPYAEDKSFKTLIDSNNLLASYFNFKIVPNGIFIGVDGTIRLLKQGFHVTKEEHVEAVRKLILGEANQVKLEDEYYNPPNEITSIEKQLSETKFKLSLEYLNNGKKDLALKELDEALLLDTDNFLIRKQRWYIRHPEKFSPSIDIEWQQEQLEKERAKEAELKEGLNCGPDGCIIPGTTHS